MAKYMVTDLTRFSKSDKVCTAVIDVETGVCLRPMPYFKSDNVKELNIQPGTILSGQIELTHRAVNPHIEDASYVDLKFECSASGASFKSILDQTLSDSISTGFGISFDKGQKHIPIGEIAKCSIVTIKVSPQALHIHEDQYKPGKIKASFTDSSCQEYRYLSITDRGFFDYAIKHQADGQLAKVQRFILTQEEIYLRIGVGRQWKIGERDGFWLQVNGIYIFPKCFDEIRTY